MRNILVLTYHNIPDTAEQLCLYDVSLQAFKEQIGYLCNKYKGDKKVLLTFDDGYKTWSGNVLNLLKNFNLRAYFFVCIKNINEGLISKDDIVKLRENNMIIGSHSLTHRFLHLLSDTEIFYELVESKRILEGILGERVRYFSVPRGICNAKIREIAKDAGYERLFTSEVGINSGGGFILKRVPIRRGTSLDDFKDIVSGRIIRKMIIQQKFKDAGKSILGIGAYNCLRRMLVPRAENV